MHARAISSRLLLALVAALGPACKPPATAKPVTRDETHYYVGTVITTAPDGVQAYGPELKIAARRGLDADAGTIEEYVVHPGKAYPTRLRRTEGSGEGVVFAAEDEARSFSGTVTFTGPDWAWTAWAYDIVLRDGSGSLRGTGRADARSIDTDKLFIGPDGQPRARIREHLERVDAPTFTRTRDELLKMPGDAAPH